MSLQETESEIQNDDPKQTNCGRKCLHQGDRICYNDDPTKEITKTIPENPPQSSASTESVDTDSIHTGESLFKTFSFAVDDSDPDLQKCLAFWKSILGKNVKPIKCKSFRRKEQKEKTVKKEASGDPCDQEQTKAMWINLYKDLQRRKLDKLKLSKNKKCDPCDEYMDDESEKLQDAEDIKNLNTWKSQTKPATKIDVKSQVKRTLQVLQAARSADNSTKHTPKKISSKSKVTPIQETHPDPSKHASTASKETEKTLIRKPPQNVQKETESEIKADTVQQESPVNKISCCNCGCYVEDCICADMEKIGISMSEKLLVDQLICPCGCGNENCSCESQKPCGCSCGITECICENLEEQQTCTCGCGISDCICQELFSKVCNCGNANCDCDMMAILNTYLETLDTPITTSPESSTSKWASTESQTDQERKWMLETTQMPGSYCIICGHFNCNCKITNKT